MKKLIFALPLFALVFFGCENVKEPINIEDGVIPAFVIIETQEQNVLAGGSLEVLFQLGQTQEENVTVQYSVSGDAIEGEDFVIVGGSDGTVTIEFDSESTNLDRGSLFIEFPIEAALGTARDLTLTIESATTASGESLTIGRGDTGASRTYTINGLGEVATGTYTYEADGAFGPFAGSFEVIQPEEPIVVGGEPFLFVTTNIAGPLFGVDVAYAFNSTAGGTIIGAPNAHEPGFETIVADVDGSYDAESGALIFDVVLQCCGAEGAGYTITANPQ